MRGSSTPPGGPAPEIVVTPEQEDVRFVPPPLHLEHDNFLGPSSARRGLYASSNYDSSNSLDSRRLSTGSTGSVGITIEPPSRPSSVTGGSRPSSAAGHGYLSPNSASMPLPPPSNPQPAPVIPTGFGGGGSGGDNGGLPWNFVPMAVTPSQQNAPLDPSGGGGRPYSPYAPPIPSSSEAPVIPSMGGGGGKSKSKKQKQKQKAQGRETYAAAPTPPGFSYPAPLGVGAATPGSGSYLRGLPKQKQRRRDEDDSDSGSVSTDGSESDEVGITIIPPPETRPVHVGGKGRRVAFS
ncbi:hypothetical protein ONZ45_g4954 [Pleurotus djamor]|nr:hypothetical protein ONZ45_g4954 [Pleurotus djamor]